MCADGFNVYKSITEDVLNLYLKTKNKSIEEVYLKCAAASNASFEEFLTQFMAIPENSGKISAATTSTIQDLYKIQKSEGDNPQLYALTQYFVKNPTQMTNLPVIKLLGDIFGSGILSDVLSPFAGIFSSSKSLIPRDASGNEMSSSLSKDQILKDLFLLDAEYKQFLSSGVISGAAAKPPVAKQNQIPDPQDRPENPMSQFDDFSEISTKKKKETRHEKLLTLVRYSLTSFVDDLKSSATQSGRQDLEKLITIDNLSDPRKAASVFPNIPNSRSILEDVPKLIKNVFKKIPNSTTQELHDEIRSRALLYSNIITQEEYVNSRMNSLTDLSGVMGARKEHSPSIAVAPYKLLSHSFIFYISLVIFHLMQKSK